MPLALDRWALAEEQQEEAKALPSTPSYWQPQVYRDRMYVLLVGSSSRASCPSNATVERMQLVAYRCGSTSSANMRLDCMYCSLPRNMRRIVGGTGRRCRLSETKHGECRFWHPWLGAVHVSLALIDLSTPSALASVSRTGSLHRYSMVDSS